MADPTLDDAYGVDLKLSETGDLVVWGNGALATLAGPDNCVQALYLRSKTVPGELPSQPEYGSSIPIDEVGAKVDPDALRAHVDRDLRELVRTDPRFINVEASAVDFPFPNDPRSLHVRALIRLVAGELLAADLLNPITGSTVAANAPDDITDPLAALDAFEEDDFLLADNADIPGPTDQQLLDELADATPTFGPGVD